MFKKIGDFQKTWGYESAATEKLFGNLTDEALGQKVTEDGRSLGFLAWHIVTTMNEMFGHAGLEIDAPGPETSVPENASEILAAYKKGAESILKVVAENWSDEELGDEIPMYGEKWPKSGVLYALIAHEGHHRGQMTVLMRQAGLRVPGIYGPAKEEWEQMGMPAMA
ncbi:MAG: DinB family protein [Pyrinomonadaceae bacterium]